MKPEAGTDQGRAGVIDLICPAETPGKSGLVFTDGYISTSLRPPSTGMGNLRYRDQLHEIVILEHNLGQHIEPGSAGRRRVRARGINQDSSSKFDCDRTVRNRTIHLGRKRSAKGFADGFVNCAEEMPGAAS
jgi:hypothetical protein